jgi:[protein-PII] uridylyltransferase
VDRCLRELFDEARADDRSHLSLVALGGFGRCLLTPRSDVDLLLLHGPRDRGSAEEVAERLFYPLWDAGFAVGNAVRARRDCLAMAEERVDVATSLLDGRFLAGDEELFASMHHKVATAIRGDRASFLRELRLQAEDRHERFGSVSHLLEPDLKEGSGGLRDIHSLGWIGWAVAGTGDLAGLEDAGHLHGAERAMIEDAEEFLTRVRSAIHLETGKKTDRVLLDAQPSLAGLLGFEDEPNLPAVDALMRATFERARAVEHVVESVWTRVSDGGRRDSPAAYPKSSPERLLRLLADAASSAVPVPWGSLEATRQEEGAGPFEWTAGVRDAFLKILRLGSRGAAVLEALDRAGLLVGFVPEWDAVRCRPQRDPFHTYTVDVHLLETMSGAVRLLVDAPKDDPVAGRAAAALGDHDGLLLGALLHDIGKTGEGGHVEIGARLAETILARIGIEPASQEMALFLVENHLLLSDTATRRDLEDEGLVLGVAARIREPERLAALYLLTAADASATGPHAWTSWRATLVRELVAKVEHLLERGDMGTGAAARLVAREAEIREALEGEDSAEVERFLERMPPGYLLAVPPDRAGRHFRLIGPPLGTAEVRTLAEAGARPGTYALTVVARDRPGLLSRIAGSLALSGLSILTAQVFTTEDGVALDVFDVEGSFPGEVEEERWRKFRSTLRRTVEGRVSLEYRVREKRRYYEPAPSDIPVKVTVDNDSSDFFTVIEVGAGDRLGLLFDITRALADLELDVHFAKVATYGGRVVDAFYVRDVLGQKVKDDEHLREISRAITVRLAE